jgi:exocyst complex component 4
MTDGTMPHSPDSPSPARSKAKYLSQYLDDLHIRPNEAPLEVDEQNYRNSASASTLKASASMSMGISSLSSRTSLTNMIGSSSKTSPSTNRDPEADSFTYIETLLESLAVLGKLGHTLDVVSQKLPQEIYSLVENTLDEVSERAEYGRRASIIGPAGSSANMGRDSVFFLSESSSVIPTMVGSSVAATADIVQRSNLLPASSLRLTALELSTKRMDQEILRDFFWTLYSKLDAVAQGLRVVYEVSNRIGSVSPFIMT